MLHRTAIIFVSISLLGLSAFGYATKGIKPDSPQVEYLAPVTPYLFNAAAKHLPKAKNWKPGDPIKEIPKKRKPPKITFDYDTRVTDMDPLLSIQQKAVPAQATRAFSSASSSWDGQSYTGVNPPDTVGDVGINYYIQMINGGGGARFTIYNKSDGSIASGPSYLDGMGSGNCADGHGDPIVLFDELAGRWLMSEFSDSGNDLCIYISQTGDPTSTWYAYNFLPPTFPDYPKYAVGENAYYISANEGPAVYALDRAAMLNGVAASMQRIAHSSLAGFGFQAMTPGDHDGVLPPPAGSPGYFMRHRDDEAHNPSNNNPSEDYLEVWAFDVDFNTPANTSFNKVVDIAIAEFDSDLCGLTSYSCMAMPATSIRLDPLREVIMWRLQYQNFSAYESLVGNFVTDVDGNDRGGIRWFEVRKYGTTWQLYQEGTYSPDSSNRWMGAIAVDGSGNLALGYNISDSSSVDPGIKYAGRLNADPLGALPQGEYTLVDGTHYNGSNRYGDYSAMSVDPADHCTFWFTGEYNMDSAWSTRIGSFKFDSCTGSMPADFTLTSPTNLSPNTCSDSSYPITLDIGSISSFANDVNLTTLSLPANFAVGFSNNPVAPAGQSIANISIGAAALGSYAFSIQGDAVDGTTQSLDIDMEVYNGTPATPLLQTPVDGSNNQPTAMTFTWTATANATFYTIEIASDLAFSNMVESADTTDTTYSSSNLNSSQTYYWRVTATNPCGAGVYSSIFSFTASIEICSTPNLPIPDNTPLGVADTLQTPITDIITDLNIQITTTHTWVGDLSFTLEHVETGNLISLINRPGYTGSGNGCGADNIAALLDDEGTNGMIENACPPASYQDYTPDQPLSSFDAKSLAGTWRLLVSDNAYGDTGTLDSWCLKPALMPYIAPDCDGVNPLLSDAYIPAGESVTCNVTAIQVDNLNLRGDLIINKSGGSAQFVEPMVIGDGGHLEVNDSPTP